MKTLPNDITRCTGYKCCMALKSNCKRWIENDKTKSRTISIADFTPTKEQGSKWNCEHKISRR